MGSENCRTINGVLFDMMKAFLFWMVISLAVSWCVMFIAGVLAVVGAITLGVIFLKWIFRKVYFWLLVIHSFILTEVLLEDDETGAI